MANQQISNFTLRGAYQMVMQRTVSKLVQKVGNHLDAAVKKHAADETDYGFVRLPPGITRGVCQLVECKFDQYKPGTNMKMADGKLAVGEYFFLARGVVLEPEYVDVGGAQMKVRGLQTTCNVGGISPPVFDTKKSNGQIKTAEEWIADIQNEMRKLGYDTTTMQGIADLEPAAEALKQVAPYFWLSTSQGKPTSEYPDPRVWENWNGCKGLEGYVPPEPSSGAAPASPTTQPSPNGAPPPNAPAVAAPAPNDDADGALTDLAAKADAATSDDDPDLVAIQELAEGWVKTGRMTQAEIEGAANWVAIVEKLTDPTGGSGSTETPTTDQGTDPQKDDVYQYKFKNAKTKRTRKIEVTVLTVNKGQRTVTVRDEDTKKPLLGEDNKPLHISWDDLVLE